MSGGYLEGFKKIYSGKNVLKSHLFLFALFVGLSIPSVIAIRNSCIIIYTYSTLI